MSNAQTIHDLALIAVKSYIDTNMPEYINQDNGYNKLVNDLNDKYTEAVSILKNSAQSNWLS